MIHFVRPLGIRAVYGRRTSASNVATALREGLEPSGPGIYRHSDPGATGKLTFEFDKASY
jgi:hypothetical protein